MKIDAPCRMYCLDIERNSTGTGMVACHDVGTRQSTGLSSVYRSNENDGDHNGLARSCKQEPHLNLKQTQPPMMTIEARQAWCCRPVVATRTRLRR